MGPEALISTARAECGVGGTQPAQIIPPPPTSDFLVSSPRFFSPATQFSIPVVIQKMTTPVPAKRQQREEYRRKIQEQAERGGDGDLSSVKMPQKRFFRQRAHANPFSDHNLD